MVGLLKSIFKGNKNMYPKLMKSGGKSVLFGIFGLHL